MLNVREKILGDVISKNYNIVFLDFKRKFFRLSKKVIGTVFKTTFSLSEETSPEENILLQKSQILFFGLIAKSFQALTETTATEFSEVHANCA